MTANRYAKAAATPTPQNAPLPGRDQIKNDAGGFVFALDKWTRLHRFLLLGAEGGTYYCGEDKLIAQQIGVVSECVSEDAGKTLDELLAFAPRAPKTHPWIYTLAAVAKTAKDAAVRSRAYDAVAALCGTPTMLFEWIECAKALGGFGSGLQRAIRKWYLSRDAEKLAYQTVKYKQREGWTHRDALRVAHLPVNAMPEPVRPVLAWAAWREGQKFNKEPVAKPSLDGAPKMLAMAEEAATADEARTIALIADGLPRECVRSELLAKPKVWEALASKMPITAFLRNLGNLGKHELLAPFSPGETEAMRRLADAEALAKANVHPLQLMLACGVYGAGRGDKGKSSWLVNARLTTALLDAFLARCTLVARSEGPRILLALDSSSSMSAMMSAAQGLPAIHGGAMLCAALANKNAVGMRFDTEFMETVDYGRADVKTLLSFPFGPRGTDCSAPFRWAAAQAVSFDMIVVVTDNETWEGTIHPCVAFEAYRTKFNPNCKAVSVALTATAGSIADPLSPAWLSVVGLDASLPQVVAEFSK